MRRTTEVDSQTESAIFVAAILDALPTKYLEDFVNALSEGAATDLYRVLKRWARR